MVLARAGDDINDAKRRSHHRCQHQGGSLASLCAVLSFTPPMLASSGRPDCPLDGWVVKPKADGWRAKVAVDATAVGAESNATHRRRVLIRTNRSQRLSFTTARCTVDLDFACPPRQRRRLINDPLRRSYADLVVVDVRQPVDQIGIGRRPPQP